MTENWERKRERNLSLDGKDFKNLAVTGTLPTEASDDNDKRYPTKVVVINFVDSGLKLPADEDEESNKEDEFEVDDVIDGPVSLSIISKRETLDCNAYIVFRIKRANIMWGG